MNRSTLADDTYTRLILAGENIRAFRREDVKFATVQLSPGVPGVIIAVKLRTIPLSIFTCRKDGLYGDNL